jgi:hypothetical protein
MEENKIKLEWLILADAAQMMGNKLYMLGGGWNILAVPGFPTQTQFCLVLAFQVPWMMTNRRHDFQIELADQDGQTLFVLDAGFEVGRPIGLKPGQTQRVPATLAMGGTFPKAGTYVIIVRDTDGEHGRISFDLTTASTVPPVVSRS